MILKIHEGTVLKPDFQRHIFVAIRSFLIIYITLAFSDAINYLSQISPYVLYGLYGLVLGSILLCVAFEEDTSYHFEAIGIYLFWLFFYFLWTILVSQDISEPLSEAVRSIIRNITVLLAFPIALNKRNHISILANLMQYVVIINCAICIWEFYDPTVLQVIATIRAEDAFVVDPNRSAGLWYNPNPAAFGFLLGSLMSYWTKGIFGWFARIASLIGIYLTVSRSGLYLLLLCGIIFMLSRLRTAHITSRHWTLISGSATCIVGLLILFNVVSSDVSGIQFQNWNVQRLLDIKEDNSGELSRVDLSKIALDAALTVPWYGNGLFTFQGSPQSPFKKYTDVGAHDIYIVILGEAGIPGVIGFMALLLFGFSLTLFTPMKPDDRLILSLLWLVYLFIGFVNHNQFTSFLGTVHASLLFHLPLLCATRE